MAGTWSVAALRLIRPPSSLGSIGNQIVNSRQFGSKGAVAKTGSFKVCDLLNATTPASAGHPDWHANKQTKHKKYEEPSHDPYENERPKEPSGSSRPQIH
jgi:hypothetical protein